MTIPFEHPPSKVVFARRTGIIDVLKNTVSQLIAPCSQFGKTVGVGEGVVSKRSRGDAIDKAVRIIDFKRGTEIVLQPIDKLAYEV